MACVRKCFSRSLWLSQSALFVYVVSGALETYLTLSFLMCRLLKQRIAPKAVMFSQHSVWQSAWAESPGPAPGSPSAYSVQAEP